MSNGNNFERIWKESAMAYFKVLVKKFASKTEENNENSESDQPASRSIFEPGTSQILSNSPNYFEVTSRYRLSAHIVQTQVLVHLTAM